jgi:phosphatidylglycerol:prolipoprotein diacylglycerol transferase
MIEININPNIATVGPLLLTWHGLFSAIGLALGIFAAGRMAQRHAHRTPGLEDQVYDTAFWAIIGGIVGARLLHVIDQWQFYAQNPMTILAINEGGIAIYGAILGGSLAGWLYVLWKRYPVGQVADCGAAGLVLGQAVGRLGDVINGEHHGLPAPDLPFSVRYTHPETLGEYGLPVHLAVGYELVWDVLVFGIVVWLAKRGARPGVPFWTYAVLYAAGRFIISFYRVDNIVLFGLRQAQLVALGFLAVGVLALVLLQTRRPSRMALAGEQ